MTNIRPQAPKKGDAKRRHKRSTGLELSWVDEDGNTIKNLKTTHPDDIPDERLQTLRDKFLKTGPMHFAERMRSYKYPGRWWLYYIEVDGPTGIRVMGQPILLDGFEAVADKSKLPNEIIKKYYPQTSENLGLSSFEAGKPQDPKDPRGGCSNCQANNPDPIKWLGIRWMGVPKPIRWWKWLTKQQESWRGYTDKKYHIGCGCIWKLKSATLYLRKWRISVKHASKQYYHAVKNA